MVVAIEAARASGSAVAGWLIKDSLRASGSASLLSRRVSIFRFGRLEHDVLARLLMALQQIEAVERLATARRAAGQGILVVVLLMASGQASDARRTRCSQGRAGGSPQMLCARVRLMVVSSHA